MTNSGKIVLAETKGEHLKNNNSHDKIAIGQARRNLAGSQFNYYMVFANDVELLPGVVSMKQFVEIIATL